MNHKKTIQQETLEAFFSAQALREARIWTNLTAAGCFADGLELRASTVKL